MMESKDKLPGKKPQSGLGGADARLLSLGGEPWRRLRGHVEFELLHCLNPGLVHQSPLRRGPQSICFSYGPGPRDPAPLRLCSLEACPLEVQSGCLGNPRGRAPGLACRRGNAAATATVGRVRPGTRSGAFILADADAVAPEMRGPLRYQARRGK